MKNVVVGEIENPPDDREDKQVKPPWRQIIVEFFDAVILVFE